MLGGASYSVKKLNTRRGWTTRQDFGSGSDFRSDEATADNEDIEQRGGMTQGNFPDKVACSRSFAYLTSQAWEAAMGKVTSKNEFAELCEVISNLIFWVTAK